MIGKTLENGINLYTSQHPWVDLPHKSNPQDEPRANPGPPVTISDAPMRAGGSLQGDAQPESWLVPHSKRLRIHISERVRTTLRLQKVPTREGGVKDTHDLKAASLKEMFEEFLKQQNEITLERHGIVFLGQPSSLTFALEEYQRGRRPRLHDMHDHIGESASMIVIEQEVHPIHLDAHDIASLKAKGAFEYPKNDTADAFMSAYLERFHPPYSIVKNAEFEIVYRERKLPWVLPYAVCFIGATFCNTLLIYQF